MRSNKVSLYICTEAFTILDTLFLPMDKLYIQYYDPVGGKPQLVFNSEGTQLGAITSEQYLQLKEEYIEN